MGKRMRVVVLITAIGCLTATGLVASAQEETATVTVFHAVPAGDGFPADVYWNGDLIIEGFMFATASEPTDMPAGIAEVEIYPNGADPSSTEPAAVDSVTLEAGRNYSIVGQLLDGAPVISVFVNDTSPIAAGDARLTVRQTSAVNDVGVVVDGESTFSGLASASEASIDLLAGAHAVAFRQADAVVAEDDVVFEEGALTVLYTVGADNGTFGFLVQQIDAAQTAPAGVPSGNAGLKVDRDPLMAVTVAAIALVGLSGLAVARKQR